MKRIFSILIIVVLQLTAAHADSAESEKKALTRKLMDKSGMNEQIRQLPPIFSAFLSQEKAKIPPDLYITLERQGLRALDPERILGILSRQMENNLDVKTLREVLAWLDSGLGQKITLLEKENTTPEAMRGMQEFDALLKKTPPSKRRSDLMQRFIEADNSAETSVDIQMSMALTIVTVINAALPEDKRQNPDSLQKKIEELRQKLQEETHRTAITSGFYTYRTLTDDEFQRYVEFAESESGRRYHRVTYTALKEALQTVSASIAKSMADVVKRWSRKDGPPDKVIVRLKDGRTLIWENYAEKADRYCTWRHGGEFCINKRELSSIAAE